MTSQARSEEHHSVQAIADQPHLPVSVEFMDTAGKYSFRAYLGFDFNDQALAIIDRHLAEIVASQSGLANGQLYDELHARLCGPEPMERDHLLLFMGWFSVALMRKISEVAQLGQTRSAEETSQSDSSQLKTNPVSASPVPTDATNVNSLINLALAETVPRQASERLEAFNSLKRTDPNAALVFELIEFIGCTKEEVAQLTIISAGDVDRRFNRATLALQA